MDILQREAGLPARGLEGWVERSETHPQTRRWHIGDGFSLALNPSYAQEHFSIRLTYLFAVIALPRLDRRIDRAIQ